MPAVTSGLLATQAALAPLAGAAATIQTDLFVYQSGDTVTVTGDGFGPVETVDVITVDPVGTAVDQGSASTDASGNFTYQFVLNVTIAGLYTVTGTGQTTGLSASTQFDPPNLSFTSPSLPFAFPQTGVGLSSSPVTFTVKNTDSNANNATVASSDPNFSVSTNTLNIAGNGGTATFTVTFSPQTFGSKSATISVTPNQNQGVAATGTVTGTTPSARTTATTVACSPSSVIIGNPTTCTATVTDNAQGQKTAPAGDVTWSANPTGQGSFGATTCTLSPANGTSSTCSVTYTPSSPAGSRTITASYADHDNHSASSGSTTLTVAASTHSTTTSISCAPSTGAVNATTSCTATVTDTNATPVTPTGTVSGWATSVTGGGTFSPTSCALSGTTASASCAITFTPAAGKEGTQDITGAYGGDGTHSASSNNASPFALTVTKRTSSTAVACVPSGVAVGVATTCTATVTDSNAGTAITPTGTVSFASSGTGTFSSGSCSLAAGTCSVTFTPSATGGHGITATYGGDTDHLGSSNASPFVVSAGVRNTSTSVSCSPASVAVNATTTCTAIVTDTNGGSPTTPTGSVAFATGTAGGGTFSPASCALAGGQCSVSFTPAPGKEGTQNITGAYGGDGTHAASNNNGSPFALAVTKRTTATVVVCTPGGVAVGVGTTCTVTVTDSNSGTAIAPTGTVTFASSGGGSFSPTSCTLSGGSCSVIYTPSATGSHGITANYGGDTDHLAGSNASPFVVNVGTRSTSTSVSCSPASVPANVATTCSATVADTNTGTSNTPTGSVTFATSVVGGGSFSPLSCTLSGGHCSVSFTPAPGKEGHQNITGAYGGDATHSTSDDSSSPFVLTVITRTTATTVSCIGPVPVNAPSTCTVTVSDNDGGTAITPAGTVSLSSSAAGGFAPGASCTLAAGACSVTYVPALGSEGVHTITASYGGDTDHAVSAGSSNLTATMRATSTLVTCSPATVAVNASSTCTATVGDSSAGTAGHPTGTVTFGHTSTGAFDSSSCLLGPSGSGQSTCSVGYTPAVLGDHLITASTTGSGDYAGSADAVGFNVSATRRAAMTEVDCSPATLPVNSETTCTATVDDVSDGNKGHPTGSVSFAHTSNGGFDHTTCTLSGSGAGESSCSVKYTPALGSEGGHVVTAVTTGTGDFGDSADATGFTVTAAERTTTTEVLCSSLVPVNAAATCTVTVTDDDTGAAATPGGTVSFTTAQAGSFDSTSCVLASGTCAVHYTPAPGSEGEHRITATYGGDTDHLTSSGVSALTASKRTSSTGVVCSSPVPVNSPGVCTASVTDTDGGGSLTPGGTVTFSTDSAGSFSSAACTLGGGSCSVSYTAAPGSEGVHTITGIYTGDSDHETSTGAGTLTAAQRATSTSLSCASPVPVDASSLCTVTVTDTDAASAVPPTGTVSLSSAQSGSFDSASCVLSAGACTVEYTPGRGSEGDHHLTATYGGDTDHKTSSGTATVEASERATTTSVDCSPATLPVNSPTTCTATVYDASPGNPGHPSGTVSLAHTSNGGFDSTTCTLTGTYAGQSSCSVAYTPAPGSEGPHVITAATTGSGDYADSSDGTGFTLTATQRTTSTSVSCTSPVPVNAASTCTVTVTDTDAGTPTTPAGTVTFTSDMSGGFSPVSCTLSSGSCSFSYTPALGSEGDHHITGSYGGDVDHKASSGAATVTATQRTTSTSFSCSSASVPVNAPVSCTATVSDTDDGTAVTPTGTVSFGSDTPGSFSAVSCSLSGGSCSVSYTPALGSEGDHHLTASYGGDTDHKTSSGGAAVTATQRATSTFVACATPVPVNSLSPCTVTVTDSDAGGKVTPSGSVGFSNDKAGTFSSPACTLILGSCSLSYRPALGSEGTHAITASYGGDGDHVQSGGGATVVATTRTTATTVDCTPTTVPVNGTTTCTATVFDTSRGTVGHPTGAVSFSHTSSGAFSPSSCTLSGTVSGQSSCSVGYTPAPGSEGSHVITAATTGSGDYADSADTTDATVTATQRATSTSVACATPVPVNSLSPCTVTVTDTDAGIKIAPTGSVSFSSDKAGAFSSPACTLVLGSCGLSYRPALGSEGMHAITGSYAGDGDHASSAGAATVSATQRTTVTSVSCSPSSPPVNGTATCTVTVIDNGVPTAVTPTGAVTFSSDQQGSFSPVSCSLSGGSCTVSYTPGLGSEGDHHLTASYGGDTDHKTSSGAATVTSTQRMTSTSVSCTTPVPVNAASTCTVTVSDTDIGTATTPTGTVSFSSDKPGSFSPVSCTLAGGSCSVTYTPVVGNEGDHHLTASYAGDTDHKTSSGTSTVTAIQRTTSTSLSCAAASVPVNAAVSCAATVSDDDGGTGVTPTGTVIFSGAQAGSFSPVSCSLSLGTCSVSYTPALGSEGTHHLTASYAADTDHKASSGTAAVTATQRTTSTSFTCSAASVPVNAPDTCTATVSDTDGGTAVTPTGAVTFSSDRLGSFSPVSCSLSGGSCSVGYTPAAGSEGDHHLTASYTGDTNHMTSSGAATVTATQRTTSTSLSCTSPVVVNAPSTCTVSVSDSDSGTKLSLNGTVTFTSDGLGTFSSASCSLTGGSCWVTYTPGLGSEGDHHLSASYGGDTDHKTSSTSSTVSATRRSTSTSVGCAPNAAILNGTTLCTATVADTSPGTKVAPSGTVTWTKGSLPGTLSSTTCALIAGAGGIATCSVIYTATAVGSQTLNAAFSGDTDHAASAGSATVAVGYVFVGFLSPVNNPTVVNTGNAGKTYPVKWQLQDANGNLVATADLSKTKLQLQETACSSFATSMTDPLDVTATGGTSLRYDTTSSQYIYNWATSKSMAGRCFTLFLTLDSGQVYTAYFKLS